jgi:hypothetical protein
MSEVGESVRNGVPEGALISTEPEEQTGPFLCSSDES